MSWLSTVRGRFDWTCLRGTDLSAPGFHRITCGRCGRRWTLTGRMTIDYQETPASKAYVSGDSGNGNGVATDDEQPSLFGDREAAS